MPKALSVRIEDQVALVSLNRPDAANAVNTALAQKVAEFFKAAPAYRAAVFSGEGKHFCSGADLKERKGMSEVQWHEQHRALESALHAIMYAKVPVIAAVHGAVY